MVRVVFPHLRGLRAETRIEYQHWRTISDRGQRAVLEWTKDPDPDTLERKLAEHMALSEPQVPPHLRPRNMAAEDALGSAATILPAFLQDTAPSASPACQEKKRNNNNNSFMKLPLEIRNMIYQYCVFYPPVKELYHAYYSQQRPRGNGKRTSGVQRSTPTIYLLCKQITREALYILRRRVFVIDRIPPWLMGHPNPLAICNFIHRDTLQNVRYLELRVAFGEGDYGSGDVWLSLVIDILSALAPRNSIIELKVFIKIHRVDIRHVWTRELVYYELLLQQLKDWEHKHGNRPCTVQFEHWVIDDPYAYRTGFRKTTISKDDNEIMVLWIWSSLAAGEI
ncbi:hypothetical protein PG997_007782 [Apiospora hydei]|uniref:2EXR domain-containing protein n=1 Tax=Apiospora hydei TaxID=1337664 RepID=A0ABR1W8Z4_9PEZI